MKCWAIWTYRFGQITIVVQDSYECSIHVYPGGEQRPSKKTRAFFVSLFRPWNSGPPESIAFDSILHHSFSYGTSHLISRFCFTSWRARLPRSIPGDTAHRRAIISFTHYFILFTPPGPKKSTAKYVCTLNKKRPRQSLRRHSAGRSVLTLNRPRNPRCSRLDTPKKAMTMLAHI